MRSRLIFLTAATILATASAGWQYAFNKRIEGYLPGDSPYFASTAKSLLHDGDFDITNQLIGDMPLDTHRNELVPHEGFFAVSPTGRVVPKHSVVLPVLTVPFIAAFGSIGFLIANVVIAITLVAGVARLGGGTLASLILAITLFATSSWFGYCFNYSSDLLFAAWVAWTYAMAREKKWLLTGVLAGMAIWTKVYAPVILLPLAIVILPAGWRSTLKTVAGSLTALVPMCVLHTSLYGGPFVTGYDRDARVGPDGFTFTEHYSRFNQPFGDGLLNVLFDRNAGMVATAALWFIWPIGLAMQWRSRFAWALALGSLANLFFIANYDEWNASFGGNRFLFPAIALGGALLEPVFASLIKTRSAKTIESDVVR